MKLWWRGGDGCGWSGASREMAVVAALGGWGGKMADGKSFVEVEVGEDNGWKQKSETTLDLQLVYESTPQQPGWWLDGCGSSKATPDAAVHPFRFWTSLQRRRW